MKGKITQVWASSEQVEEAINEAAMSTSQQEADEYINGLLKDPAIQADMQRAEQGNSWAEMAAQAHTHDPSQTDMER